MLYPLKLATSMVTTSRLKRMTRTKRNGVPAKFIQQFLSEEHPNAIGLSVPAMPVGSPGMEVGDRFMPYKVLILFKDGTSEVYAKVKTYEEQF